MRGEVLTPEQVAFEWPYLAPLLAKAAEFNEGELEVEDIPRLVHTRKMFIGVIRSDEGQIEVALAMEIMQYPRKRALHITLLGGAPYALTHSTHLYSQLEGIARTLECSMIQAVCRPAAARLFSRISKLKPMYTLLRREVDT